MLLILRECNLFFDHSLSEKCSEFRNDREIVAFKKIPLTLENVKASWQIEIICLGLFSKLELVFMTIFFPSFPNSALQCSEFQYHKGYFFHFKKMFLTLKAVKSIICLELQILFTRRSSSFVEILLWSCSSIRN